MYESVGRVLATLSAYSKDDWDGEGAKAVTEDTITTVLGLFSILPSDVFMPSVTPLYDGSVGLFWDDHGIYLDVHIASDHSIVYRYRVMGLDTVQGRLEPGGDLARLREYLRPTFGYICHVPESAGVVVSLDSEANASSVTLSTETYEGAVTLQRAVG